ncbi:MAG: GHKL domain-containing protein [Ignavibacteriae bacterium]|nr:GHKL domain-containing protein [Ignavibacteriota bacterium]
MMRGESRKAMDDGPVDVQSYVRAILNILDDSAGEKTRLGDTQRAILNILEDSAGEKTRLEATQRAVLNILDDSAEEKTRLGDTQRAILNILEDSAGEKTRLEATQRAVLNILDDSAEEKARLDDTQRAVLNILDDFDIEKKKVEQVNVELRNANAVAQTANRELEAFSYSVSHDLRAPLRHITGYVELLQKHAVTLDEKGMRFLNVISNAAKTMGLLIDDLLSFSRMGRVEMMQKKVNLNEIVSDIVRSFENETKQRNIQWNIEQLPIISCDRNLLRVVFVNLISNAVKYTRNQPSPVIEIGSGKNQTHEIEVFVKDNGAGFNPKYTNKLFGVFQRLHTDAEFEGTGIGLATVRRIIQRHNGRTWAEGEVGKGATFYFSLPAS